MTDRPTLWITGETCGLGPLRRDLAELYWQWENELRVMVGNGRQTPESLDQRVEGLGHQMKRTDSQARFTIYDTIGAEPVPVGTCELVIQHRWRNAEFFILLGSGHRAKGIGTEATKLTLDYAFHITNLRNVYVTVLAPNTAGIKAYEKAGFRIIGARRQSGYWLGEPCDEILMDAIKDDFPGPFTVRRMAGQAG